MRKNFLFVTVAFVVAFSFLYLTIYRPYSSTFWLSLRADSVVPTLLYYIFGVGALVLSKSILLAVQKTREPSGIGYIATVICECLLLSALYVFFSRYVVEPHLKVTLSLCLRSLFCVCTVLIIPYTILTLYAANMDMQEKLAAMKAMTASSQISIQYRELKQDFIDFRDNNGVLKLTVDVGSIYVIESQDNYVNIRYTLDEQMQSYMLRCRTRDIDELLKDKGFFRCHRSFTVNLHHVKTFFHSGAHGRLLMDYPKFKEIPVSKTYKPQLMETLPKEKIGR